MPTFAVVVMLFAYTSSNASEEVCFTGYVMDRYCIERGTLLDNPSLKTLESPDKHSIHCLVDVGLCIQSEFEMLADPTDGGGLYCRAFTLDKNGHDMVLALARKTGAPGRCKTCTSGGSQEAVCIFSYILACACLLNE